MEVQKALVHKLLMCRVRPYYLYQCDLINGSSHLRTPVAQGIEIIEGLRGHTTGYAIPQFVIDAPGGGGKVPINPNYVVHRDHEKTVLRNYEGEIFEYPEPTLIPRWNWSASATRRVFPAAREPGKPAIAKARGFR